MRCDCLIERAPIVGGGVGRRPNRTWREFPAQDGTIACQSLSLSLSLSLSKLHGPELDKDNDNDKDIAWSPIIGVAWSGAPTALAGNVQPEARLKHSLSLSLSKWHGPELDKDRQNDNDKDFAQMARLLNRS